MSAVQKSVLGIVLAVVYMGVVSYVVQFSIYPYIDETYGDNPAAVWIGAAAQTTFYLIVGLPFFFVMKGRIARLFEANRTEILIAAGFVAAGIIYALVIDHQTVVRVFSNSLRQITTVPVEELIFRGYIFNQSFKITTNSVYVILINVVCFTAVHIPYVLEEGLSWPFLIGAAALGLATAVFRLKTGNLVVGCGLHAFLNLM